MAFVAFAPLHSDAFLVYYTVHRFRSYLDLPERRGVVERRGERGGRRLEQRGVVRGLRHVDLLLRGDERGDGLVDGGTQLIVALVRGDGRRGGARVGSGDVHLAGGHLVHDVRHGRVHDGVVQRRVTHGGGLG